MSPPIPQHGWHNIMLENAVYHALNLVAQTRNIDSPEAGLGAFGCGKNAESLESATLRYNLSTTHRNFLGRRLV